MTTSIRVHWGRFQGRQEFNWNEGRITKESVVVITASEYGSLGHPPFQNESMRRFVGAADIEVHNISPSDGRVTFVLEIKWEEPLYIMTDITILNDTAEVNYMPDAFMG
jgi:hypothetical protein